MTTSVKRKVLTSLIMPTKSIVIRSTKATKKIGTQVLTGNWVNAGTIVAMTPAVPILPSLNA